MFSVAFDCDFKSEIRFFTVREIFQMRKFIGFSLSDAAGRTGNNILIRYIGLCIYFVHKIDMIIQNDDCNIVLMKCFFILNKGFI